MNKSILLTAGLLIVTAIVLGAFGAHALEQVLSTEKLTSFETGVRYQMYTGLALLVLGSSAERFSFDLKWIHRFLLTGIILFSGSIYALSIQEPLNISLRFLGPVTPIGGTLLIAAWGLFIVEIIKIRKDS